MKHGCELVIIGLAHRLTSSIKEFCGCELVIIGLAAMQGCSYLKNQASGNHTTPPNSKHMHIQSTKTVQNSILRFSNYRLQNSSNLDRRCNKNLSSPAHAKFHHSPFGLCHVSPYSCSVNICKQSPKHVIRSLGGSIWREL